jgi:hypothetical protein
MVYQYLGEEDTADRMHKVASPYANPLPVPSLGSNPAAQNAPPEQIPPEFRQDPLDHAEAFPSNAQPSPAPGPNNSSVALVQPPSSQNPIAGASLREISAPDYMKGPDEAAVARPPAIAPRPIAGEGREIGTVEPQAEVPLPVGFVKRITRHFTVYSEGDPPSSEFLELLENLHGNLMLDLAPFSPWAKGERVLIFLFRSQNTYHQMTGRPAWSGGASSVPKRKIYLYESAELPGILAHELCHIYYDNFYTGGRSDPLWLSEGMATLIQIERGQARPVWLRENLEILERGGGFSLDELMGVATTKAMSDAQVRLWYAQSYSVVRFLIRTQYKSSFYKFSLYLREGRSMTESLYRAYGMPYNRVKALEYAWRYDITTNRLSHLMAALP